MADAPRDAAAEARRALIAEIDHAAAEIARLSHPDDRGSGERTARLASLGAWEMRHATLLARLAALAPPDDPAAREG